MGVIQSSVNSALSGTAFLLGQSGATEAIRNRYNYKQEAKVIKEKGAAEAKGRREGEAVASTFPDIPPDVLDIKKYAPNALRNLAANHPGAPAKDRLQAYSDKGLYEGYQDAYTAGVAAKIAMQKDLQEKAEAKANGEAARERFTEMLRNPDYSKDDIKGVLEHGRS